METGEAQNVSVHLSGRAGSSPRWEPGPGDADGRAVCHVGSPYSVQLLTPQVRASHPAWGLPSFLRQECYISFVNHGEIPLFSPGREDAACWEECWTVISRLA